MGPFFKKDLLVFWRDPKDNIISLVVPLVLIVVLGLVLPGWIENPASALQLKAALVTLDDEHAGLEQFRSSLTDAGKSKEEAAALITLARQASPAGLLRDALTSGQMAELGEFRQMAADAALQALKDGDVQAVISLPEGFTRDALNRSLLGMGPGASIDLTADDPALEVGALQGMIGGFIRQYNTSMAIAMASTDEGASAAPYTPPAGGVEQIAGVRPVTSFQYFTLAIGVMFAMYVASTTASKAIAEKREHLLQRILLADNRPLAYLAGKTGSTLVFSMIQLSLVTLICHSVLKLFPGYSLRFWLGFGLLTIMMGLFIAALSAVFTAVLFRLNDNTGNAMIQTFLIIIGVLGGNFVPVYVLPDRVQQFWEWLPNGLWLSTMIQWIQQESWLTAIKGMTGLGIFAAAAAGISIWIFPKEGRG